MCKEDASDFKNPELKFTELHFQFTGTDPRKKSYFLKCSPGSLLSPDIQFFVNSKYNYSFEIFKEASDFAKFDSDEPKRFNRSISS